MPTTALRRALGRVQPRLVVVFAAIALIPLIYAGLLTSANLDPTHTLDTVPAAVVDEDTGATAADGSALALGDSVTDELLASTSSSNFAWTRLDADEAASELASGAVYAVLTIPADFSSNVASLGGDDPAAASVATLSIETDDGANLIVGNIASTIGSTVTATVEKEVGESYLKNVYLGFTDVHDSLERAADGASQLADGSAQAADGSSELVVGLTRLQDGTAQLASGAGTLASGAGSASTGAATLATGLQQLADETAQLPMRATALNDGATSVAAGAQTLDTGAGDLAAGASMLAGTTPTLATGAADAATGAKDVQTGAASVADGATKALASARRLADVATDVAAGSPAVAAGAATVDADLRELLADYSTLTDAQRIAALTDAEATAAQVHSGAAVVDRGAQVVGAGTTALVGDPTSGLTLLDAGAGSVSSGTTDLAAGTQEVATGAAQVDSGAHSLSSGAQTLAAGAASLDTGAAQLANGVGTLAGSVSPLTTGIADASLGANALASGTATLSTGAGQLADGAASAAAGTATATAGSATLNTGIDSLADGSKTLTDELTDGADEVPAYTDSQAESLSTVAAAPVALDKERLNEVPKYGYGLAPYFLSLALWVGALAFYLMSAPLSQRLLATRRPAWVIALRSYLPGALMALAQGVLAALAIRFGVGVEAANLPGLIGIAVLTSLTFVAINQALISLLDAPGRFVALLLMVLQLSSAGGTYPIETAPAFFQAIHAALPLTYTVEAFRSLIAGGSIGVANAVLVLSLWLLGALAVTVLAAARRRRGRTPALHDPEPLLETA